MSAAYGRAFALWRDATPEWPDYVEHAFVRGLADGSLPRAAFLHYLRQDYLFLIHFSRAWALAVTKAEDVDEMRQCAAAVNALVNEEIALHVETCAAAGIPESDLFAAEEAPATLAYTRYVLDSGLQGDFLDMMAALSPCVHGYGEIGARLMQQAGPEHPYRDWIATYGGDDYQGLARETGTMIDAAMARRLGDAPERSPRWPRLCERFRVAARLEIGFWQMGLDGA